MLWIWLCQVILLRLYTVRLIFLEKFAEYFRGVKIVTFQQIFFNKGAESHCMSLTGYLGICSLGV